MADDHLKLIKKAVQETFPPMKRETLTLRKPPDPTKLALSLQIGFRFVERKGNRYIMQVLIPAAFVVFSREILPDEHTWIDIPLVPETYGEAQA